MGSLSRFPLQKYFDRLGVLTLFESGTGPGDGIAYAAGFPFLRIDTVEIHPDRHRKAVARFRDDARITVWPGKSVEVLASVLPGLWTEPSVVFWLDGHYPELHYHGDEGSFLEPVTDEMRFPLEGELRTIAGLRPPDRFRDVFLIDDLRIYEVGPFDGGSFPVAPVPEGLGKAIRPFYDTHIVTRLTWDEGYLVMEPV